MAGNRYFILPLPNSHSSLWDIAVQNSESVRKNLAETEMIVKLYEGDEESHPILNGVQEYTKEQINQYLIDNIDKYSEDYFDLINNL